MMPDFSPWNGAEKLEIAMTALSYGSASMKYAGVNDFSPISFFGGLEVGRSHWAKYEEGQRENGLTPKAIARRLGLRPADVQRVLQALARESSLAQGDVPGRFIGAWVNAGWSVGLAVAQNRVAWRKFDVHQDGQGPLFAGGFAQVLIAREARHGDVAVCGYLVDVWCLGLKDAMGPRVVEPEELDAFVKVYFAAPAVLTVAALSAANGMAGSNS
jgi:hypothetical protein